MELPDIQQTPSTVNIPIYRVGISNLKLPIYVDVKEGGQQHTVANIDIFVDLDADQKGTHMSRLSIAAQEFMHNKLNQYTLKDIAKYIISISGAKTCQLIYKFPYFIKKSAPVSKKVGVMYHNVIFDLIQTENDTQFIMTIDNDVTSLCPCSKELAKSYSENNNFIDIGGAHNQKNTIKVTCETNQFIWLEDIVNITNKCGSCEIYSVLKRNDEQEVTLQAYNNPLFCEDIVRKCYIELSKIDSINWFEVEASSQESIHQHYATAKINSKYIND